MDRVVALFLTVITLGLSILLTLLGLATLRSNLLGWFLLLSGLIYFFGVVVVYWLRRIQFWRSRADGETVKEERDDLSFWLIVLGMIPAFYLPPIEYLYFNALLPRRVWMQIVGLLSIFFGSVLFIWARRALGKYYSGHIAVLEGQQLVMSGPYRSIRHPAYAGYLFIALGLVLGYSSLAGFINFLLLLLPSIIYRLSVEDKLLAEHFGDQFREYANKTARLIPGVW